MTIDRDREKKYYYLLLAAWVLLLVAYGPGIARHFELMSQSLSYTISVFFIMAMMPLWVAVGLLVLLASLAVLFVGNWIQRFRVIIWFSVFVGFSLLSDEARTMYGEQAQVWAGALGLSLLGGLTIYWVRHPTA